MAYHNHHSHVDCIRLVPIFNHLNDEQMHLIAQSANEVSEIVVERKKHVLALEEKYFQFNYDSVFVEIVADKSKYEKQIGRASCRERV